MFCFLCRRLFLPPFDRHLGLKLLGWLHIVRILKNDFGSLSFTNNFSGKFNLDPNRVIDILLEMVECQPHNKSFLIQVMAEFGVGSNISQFLGFKLQHFKPSINANKKTPDSLLQAIALMLGEKAISCAEIYPHLSPPDKEMNDSYKKHLINCRQAARKLTAAVLNEAVIEENAKEVQNLQNPLDYGDNQKLGVIQQLLISGDWMTANDMMELLPVSNSYVLGFGDITYHVCHLIQKLVNPLYKKLATLFLLPC